MSQVDSISFAVPETDLAEIRGAIAVLRAKLEPRLKSLSPQDRQELPKMGDKTIGFVQKAYEYGQRHAEFRPSFLDFEALATDVKAVELLRELSMGLDPLNQALSDSLTLSGSEAFQGSLIFYGNVKMAAKAKAPGAAAIYDDLSSRFPGGGQKKKA